VSFVIFRGEGGGWRGGGEPSETTEAEGGVSKNKDQAFRGRRGSTAEGGIIPACEYSMRPCYVVL
jgi:hypothetical protein